MTNGVYRRIEVIGSSSESWEKAVENAVKKASETREDLRVCEVDKLDTRIEDGKIISYRARVKISSKYQDVKDYGQILREVYDEK